MQFEIWTKGLAELPIDCVAVGVHDDGELTAEAKALDLRCREKLSRLVKRGDFTAKAGETWLLTDLEGIHAERVLLVGIGPKGPLRRTRSRARPGAAPCCRGHRRRDAHAHHRAGAGPAASRREAALRRTPRPRRGRRSPATRCIASTTSRAARSRAPMRWRASSSSRRPRRRRRSRKVSLRAARSPRAPRSCATSPICPATSARLRTWRRRRRTSPRSYKSLRVKVLGLPEIKREKMGCFLAVTQGSEEPPRFLVIEHRHPRAKGAPTVLVGKGITFDTGGISLKDPPTMDEMKFDMSGAACVIGTMKAVAELNLPLNVVGTRGRLRKHARWPRHQAGRHRHQRRRSHRRNPQHRRRRPPHPLRRAPLRAALQARCRGRHGHADRRHCRCARQCTTPASSRTTTPSPASSWIAAPRSTIAPGTCRSPRNTASSSRATSPTWPTWPAAMAAPSPPRRSSPSSRKDLTWAHLDIAGTAYQGGAGKGSTGRPSAMLLEFLLRRAAAR